MLCLMKMFTRIDLFRHLIVVAVFFLSETDGALTIKPTDTTLVPDGSLRLNCRTDIEGAPVKWLLAREGSNAIETTEVTSGGIVTTDFRPLFVIHNSSLYDLVATRTSDTVPYCGTYTCLDNNGAGEKADAIVSTATSRPNCTNSQSGRGKVAFTCWLSVCGPAGIPLKITRSGAVEMSGTNKVTWQTDDDDLQNAEIECSANFGDSVDCRYSETPRPIRSLASALNLPTLGLYTILSLVACRLNT